MADQLFDTLLAETKKIFAEKFGTEPEILVAAPGRVNLIGEHTDYNGGYVFPMAIERYTIIAASRTNADKATIWTNNCGRKAVSRAAGEFAVRGEIEPDDAVDWTSYVQGTIACALEKGAKIEGAFNAVINSNVPLGGGLSSSASLEVAVATLMEELSGHKFGKAAPLPESGACFRAHGVRHYGPVHLRAGPERLRDAARLPEPGSGDGPHVRSVGFRSDYEFERQTSAQRERISGAPQRLRKGGETFGA